MWPVAHGGPAAIVSMDNQNNKALKTTVRFIVLFSVVGHSPGTLDITREVKEGVLLRHKGTSGSGDHVAVYNLHHCTMLGFISVIIVCYTILSQWIYLRCIHLCTQHTNNLAFGRVVELFVVDRSKLQSHPGVSHLCRHSCVCDCLIGRMHALILFCDNTVGWSIVKLTQFTHS